MCGIAGIAGTVDNAAAFEVVRKMMRTLARRGPDGAGIDEWPRCVLGHRRLAIFDLSDAGRQPMLMPDRKVGITFNGAIYNFRSLRDELKSHGCDFQSQSDTEVLLYGYRTWGIDGLCNRLRGMFAFGLWDEGERKLFLVRDRLGVKPLLYAVGRNGEIAFASTVRALRHSEFVGEIDEQALAEYLEFGYVTDNRCIYTGGRKIPAATILEWSAAGGVRTRTYWTPPIVDKSMAPTFEEAVEETERLFLRAVEKRLFADVPVGALLSGGVDSSLVCWAIAKLGGNVTAFTVGTPGDRWDETIDASATAKSLGVDHRVLNVSAEDPPSIHDLVSAYAEPFACASALGMLSVSRAVKREATVLLTGDGGDDVFLGYPEHKTLYLASRLARCLPSPAARACHIGASFLPRVGQLRRAASFLSYATGGLGAVAFVHDGLPVYRQRNLLGERLQNATVAQRLIPWSGASARQLLADFLQYDRQLRFVGEYLTKVDGATMYHALEARSPFLDQELWEYAASLSFDLRLRHGKLKAVLRELARRHIGEQVARGKKRGFSIPVQRWIAGPWREAVAESLHDSLLEKHGWIRSAPALAELERAGRKGWALNQLWYLYVLESWLRHEEQICKQEVRSDERAVLIEGEVLIS